MDKPVLATTSSPTPPGKSNRCQLLRNLPKRPSTEAVSLGTLFGDGSLDWLPTAQGHTVYAVSTDPDSAVTPLLSCGFARSSSLSKQHSKSFARRWLDDAHIEHETIVLLDINSKADRIHFFTLGSCSLLFYNGARHAIEIFRAPDPAKMEKEVDLGPMDVVIAIAGDPGAEIEMQLREKVSKLREGDSGAVVNAISGLMSRHSLHCWGVYRQSSEAVLASLTQLTDRERDVIALLLAGMSMKQISSELRISIQTTAKHRMRILDKLNVKNDVQLLLRVYPLTDRQGRLPNPL